MDACGLYRQRPCKPDRNDWKPTLYRRVHQGRADAAHGFSCPFFVRAFDVHQKRHFFIAHLVKVGLKGAPHAGNVLPLHKSKKLRVGHVALPANKKNRRPKYESRASSRAITWVVEPVKTVMATTKSMLSRSSWWFARYSTPRPDRAARPLGSSAIIPPPNRPMSPLKRSSCNQRSVMPQRSRRSATPSSKLALGDSAFAMRRLFRLFLTNKAYRKPGVVALSAVITPPSLLTIRTQRGWP